MKIVIPVLIVMLVLVIGCQSAPTPIPVPTANLIATDVARAQAVAATLTAAAPTPLPPPTWTRTIPTITFLPTLPPAPLPPPLPTSPPVVQQTYFRLVNRHSQKCLTARGINQEVVHATCSYGDDQLWYLPIGDSKVSLESKSGVCVGYNPNNTSNALFGVGCTAGLRPWTLETYDTYYRVGNYSIKFPHGHPTIVPLETGLYFQIRYESDCVDVEAWNHNEGHRLIHTECRDCRLGLVNDNQLWARYP